MLLLIVLCLIGTTLALPVPQTEDVFIQEWVPVNTISLGDEADNLFDDILKAVQVATPIVTALAGKRDIQVSDDLFADILAIVSQGPDPCGFAGCAYLLQQELAKAQAGDEADNLFDDILKAVQVATPIVTALAGKRELGDEADNIFDDILKAVQVATPIVTTLAGKRYNSFLDIDPILPVLPTPIISPLLVGRDLGDEADNLFDDILKAVQVATPIVTALAGKREVQEDFWDDLPEALMQPMGPAVALVGGKRETEDILFAPTLGPITVSISEEQENLFGDILKVVETVAPLAIAILKRDLSEEQENLWDDIMSIAQTITPLLNTVVGKREVINLDLLKPIIEPFIYPAIDKRGLHTQDTFIDDILATPVVSNPTLISILGKRQVGDESDNLFDDILSAVQVATPIITAFAGKRELTVEQQNLFDDILSAVQVATPIITAFAGKRQVMDDLYADILAVVQANNDCGIVACGLLTHQDTFDEADNLFDDILKAVQVATPIVTALAGKREVADSEWFDTFLAAVEAATPTILGVIQGAGTA